MIRNEASARKIKIRLTDNNDSITIEVTDAVPHTDQVAIAE